MSPFDKRKKLPLAETETAGRLCWFCEHCYYSNGSPGYSEWTPGTDFSLECGKGYWDFDNFDDTLTEFREQIEAAMRCADFKDRGDE